MMALRGEVELSVPAETVRVARAVFPKGNPYLTLRDELGGLYADPQFAPLFARTGRLAVVLGLQFAEGLSDRQAAEAVRSRIDWKYLLGLELTDAGFDFSALSAFRSRLLRGGAEAQLFERMLEHFKARGVLKAGGRQRTDSTHVVAAIRALNRLECVGETLRQALNAIATVAPAWLRAQLPPEWATRYGARFEAYRLPKAQLERHALAEQLGADGSQLLAGLWAAATPVSVRTLPAVEVLRQVWVQQYYEEAGQVQWRTADNCPPAAQLIQSPYDPEARFGHKRDTTWTGYKVHLTETCEPTAPHLLTQVATTAATTPDVAVTAVIQQALRKTRAKIALLHSQRHGQRLLKHPLRPFCIFQSIRKSDVHGMSKIRTS